MRGKGRKVQQADPEDGDSSFTEILVSIYKTSQCPHPEELNLK
jgi:hypothetical protein